MSLRSSLSSSPKNSSDCCLKVWVLVCSSQVGTCEEIFEAMVFGCCKLPGMKTSSPVHFPNTVQDLLGKLWPKAMWGRGFWKMRFLVSAMQNNP